MKKSFALLAAILLMVGSFGCASKPRQNEPPLQTSAANGYEDNKFELNQQNDGTVSGAPSSLGAASSGRGH